MSSKTHRRRATEHWDALLLAFGGGVIVGSMWQTARRAVERAVGTFGLDSRSMVPFGPDDRLWNIVERGEGGEPSNMAESMHEYLAESYRAEMESANGG
jgi:hypothetical protein